MDLPVSDTQAIAASIERRLLSVPTRSEAGSWAERGVRRLRSARSVASSVLFGSALLRGRPQSVAATRKYRLGVRRPQYDGFDVLTEVQFATGLP
jgi:hypothetical protein